MNDPERVEALRKAFHECDQAGDCDGLLDYDAFLALLKKGNASFQDGQAQQLFHVCDVDMSGQVSFDEFVAFIFGNVAMDKVFKLEKRADEEECKVAMMSKAGPVRSLASKAVKARGDDWASYSWKERLDEVLEIEKGECEASEARKRGAPTVTPGSILGVKTRRPSRMQALQSPKSPQILAENTPKTEARRNLAIESTAATALTITIPKALPTNKFAISDMGQEQIVSYSLCEDDLSFAGNNVGVKKELHDFRDYLRTAGSPFATLEIIKFIAKGTAGWVFLCKNTQSGSMCAMKLIRMTQARSGIKEWFCSKVLKKVTAEAAAAGVEPPGIVFTDAVVRVVKKSEAPPVIQKELENAGPVHFFMAMMQELMPWGTLEDLAKEGELSPEIMFKCLEDVARTLAMMHENHLQHRDIKPENIMLQMDEDDTVIEAKLCDFGSAQIGDDTKSCADDIRRFGVTLFSVATGEGWTKNRLIRETHENLVSRLADAVKGSDDPSLQRLPDVLVQILSGKIQMKAVAALMEELADNYED